MFIVADLKGVMDINEESDVVGEKGRGLVIEARDWRDSDLFPPTKNKSTKFDKIHRLRRNALQLPLHAIPHFFFLFLLRFGFKLTV